MSRFALAALALLPLACADASEGALFEMREADEPANGVSVIPFGERFRDPPPDEPARGRRARGRRGAGRRGGGAHAVARAPRQAGDHRRTLSRRPRARGRRLREQRRMSVRGEDARLPGGHGRRSDHGGRVAWRVVRGRQRLRAAGRSLARRDPTRSSKTTTVFDGSANRLRRRRRRSVPRTAASSGRRRSARPRGSTPSSMRSRGARSPTSASTRVTTTARGTWKSKRTRSRCRPARVRSSSCTSPTTRRCGSAAWRCCTARTSTGSAPSRGRAG